MMFAQQRSTGASVCALPGCIRPRHIDSQSGLSHDYCGRTHAKEALGNGLAEPHGSCHTCKLEGCEERVFYEAEVDRVHDYCCRTHSDQALRRGQRQESNRPTQGFRGSEQCSLPGCSAERFRDERGFTHDYCGRTHAKQAQGMSLMPPPQGMHGQVERVFRGRPGEQPYSIFQLNTSHPKYQGVKEQFVAAWKSGPAPSVRSILQVRNSAHTFRLYTEHLARVGNEVRRFHGTSLAANCHFGIHATQGPCVDTSGGRCNICSICETGFDITRAGRGSLTAAFGSLRYGRGLYFSKHSNKSNDYAAASGRCVYNVNTRVMLLCKVALGRSLQTREDSLSQEEVDRYTSSGSSSSSGLGSDYHSITGLTTGEGGRLNYEENVVYSSRAAIPSYLIIYRTD